MDCLPKAKATSVTIADVPVRVDVIAVRVRTPEIEGVLAVRRQRPRIEISVPTRPPLVAPQRQPQRKLGHDVAVRQQPLYLRVSNRRSLLRLGIAAYIARYAKRIVHVGAEHRAGCIRDDTRRPQHIKVVELVVAPN